jgi:hypothetical protein
MVFSLLCLIHGSKMLATEDLLVVVASCFLSSCGGTARLDTVRAGFGLGFANVTVFAGSAPNEHTVTGVNAAAHMAISRASALLHSVC